MKMAPRLLLFFILISTSINCMLAVDTATTAAMGEQKEEDKQALC
jgi:hypothetical protein